LQAELNTVPLLSPEKLVMKLFYMPGACSLVPHIVLEWIGKPFELGRVERGKTRALDQFDSKQLMDCP
jgi:hypothetical protein